MSVLQMTAEQRKHINAQRIGEQLSPIEMQIVVLLRQVTHGGVTVHIQDGVPIRYTIESSKYLVPEERFLKKIEQNGKK